ncbi:MAG TPA: acylphosphatase [Devosia sp.]|nr:acylphosphatase [Devosia sp.]
MTSASLLSVAAHSYSSSVEGGAPVVMRMRVAGRLDPGYLQFVAERARWLSLSGWATRTPAGTAEVMAAGPEALVGALEMACLLGPLDSVVDTIESETAAGPVTPGFAVLS